MQVDESCSICLADTAVTLLSFSDRDSELKKMGFSGPHDPCLDPQSSVLHLELLTGPDFVPYMDCSGRKSVENQAISMLHSD